MSTCDVLWLCGDELDVSARVQWRVSFAPSVARLSCGATWQRLLRDAAFSVALSGV
jgi:hypothetical protein